MFIMLPGLNVAMVLRSAAISTHRQAMAVVAGIVTGIFAWGALAAAGVGILAPHSTAYTALRWAGAAYVTWLGAKTLWKAIQKGRHSHDDSFRTAGQGIGKSWGRGLAASLGNVKTLAFDLATFPHFLPAHHGRTAWAILLSVTHATEGLVWFSFLVVAARSVRRWLNRASVQRGIDAIAGLVFIGLGLSMAV